MWRDGKNGEFNATVNTGNAGAHTVKCLWREQYDSAAKQNRLTFELKAAAGSSGYTGKFKFGGRNASAPLKVNGVTSVSFPAISNTGYYANIKNNTGTFYPITNGTTSAWAVVIPTPDDGNAAITLNARFYQLREVQSGGYQEIYFDAAINETIEITKSVGNAYIGGIQATPTVYDNGVWKRAEAKVGGA